MKIYNYNGLLEAIGEINTSKAKAENARLMSKKQKLIDLENKVKSMGILDDWYDLKSACRKANVGIMPYGRYNEDKKGPLMDACHYFKDNGIFGIDTNTSVCYSDFFGFINKNRDEIGSHQRRCGVGEFPTRKWLCAIRYQTCNCGEQ